MNNIFCDTEVVQNDCCILIERRLQPLMKDIVPWNKLMYVNQEIYILVSVMFSQEYGTFLA
jgi:hypothetical protein